MLLGVYTSPQTVHGWHCALYAKLLLHSVFTQYTVFAHQFDNIVITGTRNRLLYYRYYVRPSDVR